MRARPAPSLPGILSSEFCRPPFRQCAMAQCTIGPGFGLRARRVVHGSLCEYMVHLRYKLVRKIGRLRGSRTRGCANAAPAAMPPPTEAREGCSGLMGDACARQLDGGVDGRRPPYRRR